MTQSIRTRIRQFLAEHGELAQWSDLVADVIRQYVQGLRAGGTIELCAEELIESMSLILAALPKLASTRDQLADDTGPLSTLGIRHRSKRFGVGIGMGLSFKDRNIYLYAEMLYPAQLWRVGAEFWEKMASLSHFCDSVVYGGGECAPEPEDRMSVRHLQGSKCAVFTMIANYALLKAQEAVPEPTCGAVEVQWSWGTKIEHLLPCAAECFARLSRMNCLLQRVNYIDEKGKARRRQGA